MSPSCLTPLLRLVPLTSGDQPLANLLFPPGTGFKGHWAHTHCSTTTKSAGKAKEQKSTLRDDSKWWATSRWGSSRWGPSNLNGCLSGSSLGLPSDHKPKLLLDAFSFSLQPLIKVAGRKALEGAA